MREGDDGADFDGGAGEDAFGEGNRVGFYACGGDGVFEGELHS